jgi:hypothetical protein
MSLIWFSIVPTLPVAPYLARCNAITTAVEFHLECTRVLMVIVTWRKLLVLYSTMIGRLRTRPYPLRSLVSLY